MKPELVKIVLGVWMGAALVTAGHAEDASTLRLIPFPKQASLEPGRFVLNRHLLIEVSQQEAPVVGEQLSAELIAAGYPAPTIRPVKALWQIVRISAKLR